MATEEKALDGDILWLIVGISATVLVLVFLFIRYRKSKRGRSILLVGSCGSGKTQLWCLMFGKKDVTTVTSQKVNEALWISHDKRQWLLTDIPGSPRIRYKYLEEKRSNTRGIIFVLDSSTLQKEIRDVAELLYLLLTDPDIRSNRPKFAVFCNKQDLPLSKSESVIKTNLEKEINTLRMTKASQLESLGSDKRNNNSYFLGKEGKDFSFDDVSDIGINIVFLSGSVLEDEIQKLKQWTQKL